MASLKNNGPSKSIIIFPKSTVKKVYAVECKNMMTNTRKGLEYFEYAYE